MDTDQDARALTFARLRSEWTSVAERIAQREALRAKVVADEWAPLLEKMVARERELKRTGRWVRGRADFLGVMWLERAETRHSRLIAWLLDPLGRHGLGTAVLRGLLATCFPERDSAQQLEDAQPECEVVRGACRADIVVWLAGQTLVIENKVDASESIAQCDVIQREFETVRDPMFVFLTPKGRRPEHSTGLGLELFRPLSYSQLREIIRAGLAEPAWTGDGRHIAEDYLRTLDREFK